MIVDPISCLIGYWDFYRRLYSVATRGGCNDEVVLRIRPAWAGLCRSGITDTPLRAGYRPKKPGRFRKRNEDGVNVEWLRNHGVI